MEKYYEKVSKDHYQGKKLVDAHPENFFQVNENLNIPIPLERSHTRIH